MAKTRLLHATCAVVMLAAMPALAQTNSPPADTGAGGKVNNPMAVPDGSKTNPPAEQMKSSKGSMSQTHHAAMHMRHDNSASQDEAVDALNNRSYQAALSGQAFNGSAPGDTGMPAGTGHMNAMSGGGEAK